MNENSKNKNKTEKYYMKTVRLIIKNEHFKNGKRLKLER